MTFFFLAVAFRLYDLDRDDKISRDELLQVSNMWFPQKLNQPDGDYVQGNILSLTSEYLLRLNALIF